MKTITKQIKDQRRKAAEERNKRYESLTIDEKIAEQNQYRGKQYQKLMKLKEEQKKENKKNKKK